MNRRQNGDRFLGDIYPREDGCSLRNTRKTFVEDIRGKMTELQIKMILLRTHATALANFDGHRSRNNIARSQILCSGSITFHKAFSFGIQQVPSFTTRTYDCLVLKDASDKSLGIFYLL
jgi:hypothetical protein